MKRLNIIIVAEGAIDRNNTPITTDYIKNVSTELCIKVWQVLASTASCMTATTDYCPGVALTLLLCFWSALSDTL